MAKSKVSKFQYTTADRAARKRAAKAAKATARAKRAADKAADKADADARRAASLAAEAHREAAAAARRAERQAVADAKAAAARITAQAERIALRATQGLEWTVAVYFARGARDLRVVRAGSIPKGMQESRAARRVRGNAPGLRFSEAETIADNVGRKIPARRRA